MGPQATMQMGGYLREQIIKNAQVFFKPLLNETGKQTIDGKAINLKTKDPESKIVITVEADKSIAVLTYPIDNDPELGNGRLYVEDHFVFDPKTKTMIGDGERRFRLGSGSGPWEDLHKRLEKLDKKLDPKDPKVIKFFNDVILQIPAPSAGEDTALSPKSAPPPTSLPATSFLGGLSLFKPLPPPQSLEEAHLRRLATALSVTGGPWAGDSKDLHSLRKGLGFMAQGGFQAHAPADLIDLAESSRKNPDASNFAQALVSISRGNLDRAHFLLLTLRDRAPAAEFVLRWIEDYRQAKKNLKLLGTLRSVAEETLGKELQQQGALAFKAASLVTKEGEAVQKESEILQTLFDRFEKKLTSGEATTIEQAFSQVESNSSADEKVLLEKIQGPAFAGGVLTDLRRSSGLKGSLLDRALLAVGHEKLLPSRSSAAQGAFALAAESRDSSLAASGRDGVALIAGQGKASHQVDRMVGHFADELASPMVVSSLLIGSTAFHVAEGAALARFGGAGTRSTIIATALGLTAEAPAFELAHRGLNGAFVGAPNERSFLKGTAANFLTFGALRGTGVATKIGLDGIPEASLPFGRATAPIATHAASFGSLHAVNEFERAVNLRPKEGPYSLRIMEDGAFYVQMGLAGHLAHGLAGPGFAQSVQKLHQANDYLRKYGEPTPESGRQGAPIVATEPLRDATGTIVTDSDPTPVHHTPEIRRPSRPSQPSASEPPPSGPPTSEPPASQPPGSEPPVSGRPASEPPISEPPASNPSGTMARTEPLSPTGEGTRSSAPPPPDGRPSSPPAGQESRTSVPPGERPTHMEIDPEVVSAAAKIADLDVQLNDARQKLADLKGKTGANSIDEVAQIIRNLQAQIQGFEKPPSSKDPAQKDPTQIDPELKKARIEIDRLKLQLEPALKKAAEADAAKARVEQMETELAQKAGEAAGIEWKRREAVQKGVELQAQLEAKQTELAQTIGEGKTTLENLANQANGVIAQWRALAEGLEAQRADAVAIKERAEAKLAEVREQNKGLSRHNTEVVDDSIALETRLRRELGESQQQGRELALQVKPLEGQRAEAQRTIAARDAELEALRTRIEEAEGQLKDLEALKGRLRQAGSEKDEVQRRLESARREVDRVNRYRVTAIQARQRVHADYMKTIGELRTDNQAKGEQIRGLENDNAFLRGDRDQERLRADNETARAGELSTRVDELVTQVGGLETRLTQQGEALALAGRRLLAKEAELTRERETLERRETEMGRLRDVISKASDQAGRKDGRIKELLAEIKRLNEIEDITDIAVSDEEVAIQERVATLEREKTVEIQRAERAEADLVLRSREASGLSTRIESLQGQLGRARSNLEQKTGAHNELALRYAELNGQVEGLQREAAQKVKVEERLARSQEENTRLRTRIGEEQAKVTRATEALGILSRELAEAQQLNEQFTREMGRVLSELHTAKQSFDGKKEELRQANAELVGLRTGQKSNLATIDHLGRREAHLVERVGALETQVGEAREKFEQKQGEAATLRRERDEAAARVTELDRDLTQARKDLLKLNGELTASQSRAARLSADVELLRPEALRKGEAMHEATRANELLRGERRKVVAGEKREGTLKERIEALEKSAGELNEAFAERDRAATKAEARVVELEAELKELRPKLEEAERNARTASEQVDVFREARDEAVLMAETLTTERNQANEELTGLREVEARQAARIQELVQAQGQVQSRKVPLADEDPTLTDFKVPGRRPTPLYSQRVIDGPPSQDPKRRRHTPPLVPTIDQITNDLRLARLELEETRRNLTAAEERARTAEEARITAQTEAEAFGKEVERLKGEQNTRGDKAKALRDRIGELQQILGSRGPAYFGNTDPRVGKVEFSLKGSLPITDKKGQIVGKAEIIAGGQEGAIPPLHLENGSRISAMTSIAVPKRSQKVNEDSVYVCEFMIPDGKGGTQKVIVLAGADGAGGEKRGDLATVWLQGIHAGVAEAGHEGRAPEAKDLFQAGRLAVDAQHDLHGIPRYEKLPQGGVKPVQVTGAGDVIVIVGNQATIATAADSHVTHSRRQTDGRYLTLGYSNADAIGHIITNGIDLRAVKAIEADGLEPDPFKIEFENRKPPNLYYVKDMKPGDRFTIGSDGFWHNMNPVFMEEMNFPGSREMQNARGQRPHLLQNHFKLLNLMLEASVGQADAASHFHDWAFENMKNPGLLYSFNGRQVQLTAKNNKDNIFVISYEHGEHKNGGIRIPSEYGPMERVFDVPPPPLLEYKPAIDGDYTRIAGQYLDSLKGLYGNQVGEQAARTLAGLYRNFSNLELKFNPEQLAGARDAPAMNDLFKGLKEEVEAHPEMKAGDNPRFMEAARGDVKAMGEYAHPFQKAPQHEAREIYQRYNEGLTEVFGAQSGVAAQHFADLYHNFERAPDYAIRWIFKKGGTYIIGSDGPRPQDHEPADVLVNDPTVAPLHLKIYPRNGHWLAEDLGSPSGTYFNGQKLIPGKALGLPESGSHQIRVGQKTLTLAMEADGTPTLRLDSASMEENFNPALLARLDEAARKRVITRFYGAFHTDKGLPTDHLRLKAAFDSVKDLKDLASGSKKFIVVAPPPQQPPSAPPPRPAAGPSNPPPGGAFEAFRFEKKLDQDYVLGSLLIQDPSLSQMHAGFRFNGRAWVVRDMGSTNGSWLDRQDISHPRDPNQERRPLGNYHEVRHGSILKMGDVFVQFEVDPSGDLIPRRISPWVSGWPAAGEVRNGNNAPENHAWMSLPPQQDFTHFKVNGSSLMEIIKGVNHPGIYKDGQTPGIHYWVIERMGRMERLLEKKKVYATIIRAQTNYTLHSQVDDMKVRRGDETLEVPKGAQLPLQEGDTIAFGNFSRTFIPY